MESPTQISKKDKLQEAEKQYSSMASRQSLTFLET